VRHRGVVNWGDSETLARMTHIQAHRGPDDAGLWKQHFPDSTWVGLGNRRLAIIDLSPAGHMPMSNEDGAIWITYNGEIYNFPELRRELVSRGHAFRSNTDLKVESDAERELRSAVQEGLLSGRVER